MAYLLPGAAEGVCRCHGAGMQIASSARVDWPKASTTSTGSVTKGSLQYSENIAHRVLSTTCKAPQCSVY